MHKLLRRTVLSRLAAVSLALAGCAANGLGTASAPEDVGLSSQKLKELTAAFQARVDAGEIPGAVLLVARDGKLVLFDAVGWQDREQKVPMRRDSIFRIASMTKPVTSLAVMMLVEEGKLKLDDPVARYIPQLQDMQVGVVKTDASGKPALSMVPARAQMTVLDLLRHTSGISSGNLDQRDLLVQARYNAVNPWSRQQTNAEFVVKLATLPLLVQPGTSWEYGMSNDVLGRVVEVASGMEFGQFVTARILKPLVMNDSGFFVEPDKFQRLAQPQINPATGKRPWITVVRDKPVWSAGGGGMVSTANDYARFCQMLLNGGTLDGVRIVSAETIALMRRDHLPVASRIPAGKVPAANIHMPSVDNGYGFGLGWSVRTEETAKGIPGSIGDFTWSGGWGTHFWVDPKERLVAMFLTQSPGVDLNSLKLLARVQVYGGLK